MMMQMYDQWRSNHLQNNSISFHVFFKSLVFKPLVGLFLSVCLLEVCFNELAYSQYGSQSSVPSCQSIYKNIVTLSFDEFLNQQAAQNPDINEMILSLTNIDKSFVQILIQKSKQPDWYDFNQLELVINKIITQLNKIDLESMDASQIQIQNQIQSFYQKLNLFILQDSTFQMIRDYYQPSTAETKSFAKLRNQLLERKSKTLGPVERDMLQAYADKFALLTQYLSRSAFVNPKQLPVDVNKLKITQEAHDLNRSLIQMHDYLLAKQGISSYEAYKKIVANSDASIQKAAQMLNADDFEFAMLRPESGRFWIEKAGFHNQHVTGSSRGYMGNQGRNATEASYLGMSYDNYAKMDNDLKPKYGFLLPKIDSALSLSMPHYGTDIFIFKKEALENRVTFTLGDSLNAMSFMGKGNWYYGTASKPTAWDQVFTPWQRKEILAPFLAQSIPQSRLSINYDSEITLGKNHDIKLRRSHPRNEYVELQYWGPLNLSQVKAFAFTIEPPTGDFLQALIRYKIPIYKASAVGGSPIKYELWSSTP